MNKNLCLTPPRASFIFIFLIFTLLFTEQPAQSCEVNPTLPCFDLQVLFSNSQGFVFNDGNIYSCLRPGDDCDSTPVGRLGDKNSPLPAQGGVIGKTLQGEFVWSDGTIYSCSRPGDDCDETPVGLIALPI